MGADRGPDGEGDGGGLDWGLGGSEGQMGRMGEQGAKLRSRGQGSGGQNWEQGVSGWPDWGARARLTTGRVGAQLGNAGGAG